MTIDAIKDAITQLPEDDQLSLATWLNQQTMDDWDNEMQRDFSVGEGVAEGKGMKYLARTHAEIAASKESGQIRPLEEGLALRRRR